MKVHWSTLIILLVVYSIIILFVYTLLLNYMNIVLFPFLIIPTLLVLIFENTNKSPNAENRNPSGPLLTVFAFTCGGSFGVLFFGIGLYGIILAIVSALLVVVTIPLLLPDENLSET